MKVALGSDHAGFDLKERVKEWLEERGFAVEDVGSRSPEQVDYPDFAHLVAEAVGSGRCARGVVMCGTGIGVSITAGAMQFTITPVRATSLPIDLVIAITAAFVIE